MYAFAQGNHRRAGQTGLYNLRSVGNDGAIANLGEAIDLYNNTVTLRDRGGQLVTMDLGQVDVHIDKALANFAVGYKLAQAVGDIASPPIVVPNATDRYFQWNQDDAFQAVQDVAVSAGAQPKEVSPRLSNTNFVTQQFGLQAFIPTEVMANADAPLNLQLQYMRRVMNALILARELRVQSLLRTSSNHTFSTTLTASTKWNGGASSNPIQDLFTLIENALMPITAIVMSEQVWHDFVQNAAVQKYLASKINVPGIPFVGSDGKINNSAQFTSILGLPRIEIAAMKYKTGSSAYTYVWGGDVVLLHEAQGGAPRSGDEAAPSYTFRWSGGSAPDAGSAMAAAYGLNASLAGGFMVRTFFNPFRGPRGGYQICVTHNDAEVMTSNVVSGLLIGAHQ